MDLLLAACAALAVTTRRAADHARLRRPAITSYGPVRTFIRFAALGAKSHVARAAEGEE
jgi:hypothetical protein